MGIYSGRRSMDITVEYEPTVAETQKALRRMQRGWAPPVLAACGIGLVVGGFALILGGEQALGLLGVLVGLFYLMAVRGRRILANKALAQLCVTTRLELHNDRFRYSTAAGGGEARWELTRVVVTPGCWSFLVNRKVVALLPMRALEPADLQAFTTFVNGRDRKLVKVY
jgi:hypothetical protein